MKHLSQIFVLLALAFFVSSCDAMLLMSYSIENKSKSDVRLFVPNAIGSSKGYFDPLSEAKDTVMLLKNDEAIVISYALKIDFPWARKNIYKNQPGICGIKKKTSVDSLFEYGCSKKEWKYKHGNSVLIIKK
jgi:hypothetical protein